MTVRLKSVRGLGPDCHVLVWSLLWRLCRQPCCLRVFCAVHGLVARLLRLVVGRYRVCRRSLEPFLALVDFHAVYNLHRAINHHAPANDEQWGRGYCRWLYYGHNADEQHEGWLNPPYKADVGEASGGREVEKLVYCAKDQYGGKHVNEPVDKCVWQHGEQAAEYQAANPHYGERWLRPGYEVAMGIVNVKAVTVALAFLRKVGNAAYESRHEKYGTNEDGDPCYGLLAVFHEQCADSNCAYGAEDGALYGFHFLVEL